MKKFLVFLILFISTLSYGTVRNVVTTCGATGNGSTDDTAAINSCIALLVGGDTLFFPPGTYKITSTLTKISTSNIEISGLGGTATIKQFGSGGIFNLGGTQGTTGSQNLTVTAPELSQTINANFTALGASVGSYILIEQGPTGASGQRGEVLKLATVSGSSATVTTFLHDTFSITAPNEVANVKLLNTPVSGFNVHDLTFDGDSHTSSGALNITNVVNSSFTNLNVNNFTGVGFGCAFNGAGITPCYHFNTTFTNIAFSGIGNNGAGGIFQTELNSIYSGNDTYTNITMTSGNGGGSQGVFGFAHSEGANFTVNGLTVDATTNGTGRPFKCDDCRYYNLTNVTIQNQTSVATGDNGLTFEYFSYKGLVNGCIVSNIAGNTSYGINLYGDDNGQNEGNVSNNLFYNCAVSLTSPATQGFGIGTDDTNNEIDGGTYSATTGNYVIGFTVGGGTTATYTVVNGTNVNTPGNIGVSSNGNNACIINNTFTGSFGSTYAIYVTPGSTASGSGNVLGGSNSNLSSGSCPTSTQGAGPKATLSPTTINFGNQNVGTTSSGHTITLSNSLGGFNGTATLIFVGTPFLVTGTQYAISSNTCLTTVVIAGSCLTTITFTPTGTGTQTDTLTYYDNAVGAMQTVALTGVGISTTTPTVTTTVATSITSSSAVSGGVVTSNGGSVVTSEGVCYATTPNPTTPCTSNGTATPFTSNLTGLTSSTTYHYRAFATNANGTSYGADMTFTTLNSGGGGGNTQGSGTGTGFFTIYHTPGSMSCGPPNYLCVSRVTNALGNLTAPVSPTSTFNTTWHTSLNLNAVCYTQFTDLSVTGPNGMNATNLGNGNLTWSGGAGVPMISLNRTYAFATLSTGATVGFQQSFSSIGGSTCAQNNSVSGGENPGISVGGAFQVSTSADVEFYNVTGPGGGGSHPILNQNTITSYPTFTVTSNSSFPFDYDNCPAITAGNYSSSSRLSVAVGDGLFALAVSYTGAQGTASDVFVYKPGTGCSRLDLLTGHVYTYCLSSCSGATPAFTETNCTDSNAATGQGVHDIYMSGSGGVIEISGGAFDQMGSGNICWWVPNTVTAYAANGTTSGWDGNVHIGGHDTMMYHSCFYGVNPGNNIRVCDPLTTANLSAYTVLYTFPGPMADYHSAYPLQDTTDTDSLVLSTIIFPGQSYTTPPAYQGELVGIETTAGATPIRFGPNYESAQASGFGCGNGIQSLSQDGKELMILTDNKKAVPGCVLVAVMLGN